MGRSCKFDSEPTASMLCEAWSVRAFCADETALSFAEFLRTRVLRAPFRPTALWLPGPEVAQSLEERRKGGSHAEPESSSCSGAELDRL